MLILALALAGVTAAPAPEPQRARRAKQVRTVRMPARARPGAIRIPVAAVPSDPNRAYRLTNIAPEVVDNKVLAVQNTGMECETTGAPVCPSKGTTIVRSAIDD